MCDAFRPSAIGKYKKMIYNMKKSLLLLVALVAIPAALFAQADQKLIDKARSGDVPSMLKLANCYELGFGVPMDSVEALRLYRQAADRGSADAWMHISVYHLLGAQMPKDTARYLAIRKEWADKGAPEALTSMFLTTLKGCGVRPDTALALSYLERAAKMGDSRALSLLGSVYCYGDLGYPVDRKKAFKYWNQALAHDNYPDAAYSMAHCYYAEKDYENALKYADIAARQGQPDAITLAALIRLEGNGLDVDGTPAIRVLSNTARKYPNMAYCQFSAGLAFLSSSDEAIRNIDSARYFFQRGEAAGSLSSSLMLAQIWMDSDSDTAMAYLDKVLADKSHDDASKGQACMLYSQLLFENHPDKAMEYALMGANQYDDNDCWMVLARTYKYQGLDNPLEYNLVKAEQCYKRLVEKDKSMLQELGDFYLENERHAEALAVYQRIIDAGDPAGYYYQAKCYAEMNNEKKVVDLLKKGYKAGDAECATSLGYIYESGWNGHKPDYKKAAECYMSVDDPQATYNLAMLWLNGNLGKGSEADMQKGFEYLKKSCDMGLTRACLTVAYCYETGQVVGESDYSKALAIYEELAEYDVPVGYFKKGVFYEQGLGGLPVDSVLAVENIRKAAEMGHGLAYCYLGDYYRSGHFLPLDQQKAFECFVKAHEAEEMGGTYYVGRSYLEGCGVAVDTAAAIPYLRIAAEAGVGRAGYILASFFEKGIGGFEANGDSAFHYYYQASENGYADASYKVGTYMLGEDMYPQAFNMFMNAARGGSVDGIFLVGLMRQEGLGCEADPVEAYNCFDLIAHRADDPRGYHYMGLARLQGNGCRQDEMLGKLYLDTAAAMGYASSYYLLAICYMQGYGCEPDSAKTISCLEQAVAGGNVQAMNLLGDIYEEEEDFDKAVRYYQMGADLNNPEAICNLGYCYEKGQGVILSFKKATELYRQAAAMNHPRATRMLAACYLEGTGVDKDVNEALKLFSTAAELGDVQAMYLLGSIYEDGDEGVKKDIKEAKKWYKKAAAEGYEPAQAALNRL